MAEISKSAKAAREMSDAEHELEVKRLAFLHEATERYLKTPVADESITGQWYLMRNTAAQLFDLDIPKETT